MKRYKNINIEKANALLKEWGLSITLPIIENGKSSIFRPDGFSQDEIINAFLNHIKYLNDKKWNDKSIEKSSFKIYTEGAIKIKGEKFTHKEAVELIIGKQIDNNFEYAPIDALDTFPEKEKLVEFLMNEKKLSDENKKNVLYAFLGDELSYFNEKKVEDYLVIISKIESYIGEENNKVFLEKISISNKAKKNVEILLLSLFKDFISNKDCNEIYRTIFLFFKSYRIHVNEPSITKMNDVLTKTLQNKIIFLTHLLEVIIQFLIRSNSSKTFDIFSLLKCRGLSDDDYLPEDEFSIGPPVQVYVDSISSYNNSQFYDGIFNLNRPYRLFQNLLTYYVKESARAEAQAEIKYERKLKESIQDLVQQYTHTLSNTLFPNTIYNVAKTLKGSKKYRKEVLILEDAYQSEVMIKKQGQMLQLKQTGNADVFQSIIRSDRLFTDTKEENIEINEIINQSADRVISRFLNQDTHRLNDLREHITKVKKVDIDAWKKEYENDVFFDEKITALEWTKSRLGGIKISANKTWENIRVKRDGYAHALLQSYFMELFFNALKYRDYSKKEWAKIQLDECEKNGTEYLQMTVSNPAEKGDAKSIGMGKGLNGFKADLALLNSNDNNGEFLFIEKTKTQFSIRALLQKNLFVIKRKKRDYSKAKVALKNSK
ncbi:MAG: hypothetical protein H8E71_00610 [Candidatus Marinimicrobia bacterium]|nr:hypothetical protein [Candidatus Neomarinimicrobiota bacterium]